MRRPLLELQDVTKSFGAVHALRGVSFELKPGEIHALVGENGAGKSTLIKIISGAHQPDSGTVAIAGETVERLSPGEALARGIAVIYQQPALFPDLSVAENLALVLEKPKAFRWVRWSQRRARALELLEKIGAKIAPEREVRELSMPEQQLVEIARATGAGARILILDEPTASLTAREVELLISLLKSLREQGVGIIYITHRLDEVFQLADRVTVLRDGESIGTRPVQPGRAAPNSEKALSKTDLIQMMVGREISGLFPPAQNVPGEVLLTLINVGCSAGEIHDVSLELRAGEILGLAGLVGAGRTELARILFGLTPADSGSMTLAGQEIHIGSPRDAMRAGIAYVPEDRRRHGVIAEMPVAANITMAIHPRIFPGGWLRFDAESALASSFIQDLAIKTPSAQTPLANLSGGNQQKVALARWLAAKPKWLILDEPTQGVDIAAKAEIHKLIRSLAGQGIGILMISSDLPEILGMSDRIAVMRGGTIVATLPGGSDPHTVMAHALEQDVPIAQS